MVFVKEIITFGKVFYTLNERKQNEEPFHLLGENLLKENRTIESLWWSVHPARACRMMRHHPSLWRWL